MGHVHLDELDWGILWQEARKKKGRKSKNAQDWDRRAVAFANRNRHSLYNRIFIDLLQPEKDWTVLDVGAGPGTLSLPLAKMVRHVTSLDFSPEMIRIINEFAAKQGLTNISTHILSWEDDWRKHGVGVHDVTIASRSLGVKDLRSALEKLNDFASGEVVVTDRVGPGPFDPAAFRAIGRNLDAGPDYIYTINLLYQMGIHASVEFIRLEENRPCLSLAEAVENYAWMFHDLQDDERKKLEKYIRSISSEAPDGNITLKPEHVTTWAFMRWKR